MGISGSKGIVGKLLVSCASLVITLLIVEIGFRFFVRLFPLKAPRSSRPTAYYLPAGTKDLRGIIQDQSSRDGRFRISVVGDSIAFGPHLQLYDTFPKRLEWMLNLSKPIPPVEVVNYATPGFSSAHEVRLVEQALKDDADLIVLQIYFNDPELAPPTANAPEYVRQFVFDTNGPILRHWRSMAFALSRLHNTFTRSAYKRYFFKLFEEPETWNNFSTAINTISELAKARQTPLVAVVFPLMGFDLNQSYPFEPLHDKVHGLLRQFGIRYLDLLGTYRDIPIESLHVIPGVDQHPNEIGHRLAAEALYRWFDLKRILPERYFRVNAFADRKDRVGIQIYLKHGSKAGKSKKLKHKNLSGG